MGVWDTKITVPSLDGSVDALYTFSATDVYDLEGNEVEHPWSGPFEITGTRVEVELP